MTEAGRLDAAVPVIVGVGEVVQQPGADESQHPLALAAAAVMAAAADAGSRALLSRVDSIDVVNIVSWQYTDPARQLADAVGCHPSRAEHSDVGGHQPTRLLDAAAARIAAGRSEVALVAGGEAVRSLDAAMKAGSMPAWPEPHTGARPVHPRDHAPGWMGHHRLWWPTDVYPLYEQGSRRGAGMTQAEALREAARRWAAASRIAAANPYAWIREPRSADEIATVSPANRMVAWPYPKLLTALISVDQAAAVLVTSTDAAARLGIPEDRWVYPMGGAAASEPGDVLARSGYGGTVAGAAALDGALELAGVGVDDVDLIELYSCFPCVPRMASRHLGLEPGRTTTVAGGLTFFGGPGNNYMLHATAAAVRTLRAGGGEVALLYGQGGHATTHHAMVLARQPAHTGAYLVDDAAARQAIVDAEPRPPYVGDYRGKGEIETFTIPFDRDGQPERAVIVARTPGGERFAGELPVETDAIAQLTALDGEPLGRPVRAEPVDGSLRVELV